MDRTLQQTGQGTVRKLAFTCQIKDEENNVLDPTGDSLLLGVVPSILQTEGGKPVDILVWYEVPDDSIPLGMRELLAKLHQVGDKVTALIPFAKAFGPHRPDLMRQVSKSDFSGEHQPGMTVVESPGGRPVTIAAVGDTTLTLDYNHPCAGKNLNVTLELMDVASVEKARATRNPFVDCSLSGNQFPVVVISAEERAGQQLLPSTLEAAYSALADHGCVLLRDCFDVEFIRKLADAWNKKNPQDADAMEAVAFRAGQKISLSQHPIYRRNAKRYEITMPMTGAFGDPELFANPLVISILKESLGDAVQLCSFTSVVSFPGAALQQIHQDDKMLFRDGAQSIDPRELPPYAISVSVPLLDVDSSMGPTLVWLGSHLWPFDPPIPFSIDAVSVDFKMGDCMMFDYRLFHAGGANRSDRKRPIIYMVYGREWYYDDATNHSCNNPVDLPLEQWLALDPTSQQITQRAYTQAIRTKNASH